MAGNQEVRLSQMVVQLGPGSVVETANGPRLIPLAEHGLFPQGVDPEQYALDVPHLQNILGNRRVFRIPSNAEVGRPSRRPLYHTRAFPNWKLCVQHSKLYMRQCPDCERENRRSSRIEVIRFVMACPAGHLDEVNWNYLVHHRGSCSGDGFPEFFHWINAGGSLTATRVKCPRCRQEISLGDAYNRDWVCSGRFPEREPLGGGPPVRQRCVQRAKMMQRQATSLRIPELLAFITIPPLETRIHRLLSRPQVRQSVETWLKTLRLWDRARDQFTEPSGDQMKDWISSIAPGGAGGLRDDEREALLGEARQEVVTAMRELLTHRPAPDMRRILLDEFRAFRVGAVQGVPARPAAGPRRGSLLEINPTGVRTIPGPSGSVAFRVAPVERLHSVIVQTGYRRAVGQAQGAALGDLVNINSTGDGGTAWLPGHEAMGEGIFITSEGDGWHPRPTGRAAQAWNTALEQADDTQPGRQLGNQGRWGLHPVFVWWHTLSHLLIRSLSVESGYSLASIRERVYLEVSEDGQQARGGILLYTSGYGSDGTLGGLIALVPRFEHILAVALEMGSTCSADPLCREHAFAPGKHSGAACYACSLISETSCEQRNLWLDRNLLLDNLP